MPQFACFHTANGKPYFNGYVYATTAGEALRRFKALTATAKTHLVRKVR